MGGVWSVITNNIFPGDVKYSTNDIPDMCASGKVVLVTGGTAGIGKETARVLLTKNAKIWITARDKAKGEASLRELKSDTERDAHLLLMNLANLRASKQLPRNSSARKRSLTFSLTMRKFRVIIPRLSDVTDDIARDVNTSSNAHWFGALKFETCRDGPARRKQSELSLYGQSKGNITFSAELQRRYEDQGIVSTSLNPGGIRTELQRRVGSWGVPSWYIFARHVNFTSSIISHTFFPVELDTIWRNQPALYRDSARWRVSEWEGKPRSSQADTDVISSIVIPWARVGKPRADAQDPLLGKELWTWLEGKSQTCESQSR
ncbi:hypothetical protein BU15DRAFT_78012 [Melanogaster broomeanus]|nr:hypothetical protein BU15DRAFT_78012 [Melanogaster broomeanus]